MRIGFLSEVDKQIYDTGLQQPVSYYMRMLWRFHCVICRYVTLVIDEVHIKEYLMYNKHEGTLVGFVNLGDTNNHLLQFEAALQGDSPQQQLAKSMLVLMVRGLFSKVPFLYAQFACARTTGDLLMHPGWEAISWLE